MRKTTPTKCGECGGGTSPFTMFVNATTGESHAMCASCMANRGAASMEKLSDIDAKIEECEELLKDMEVMAMESEDMDIPPALEAFAMTPMKIYQSMQLKIAALKTRRMELLKTGENEERLQYELNKKVEEENYEEADSIKKRIAKLRKNAKKRRGKRKKQQPTESILMSHQTGAGKCIKCKQNYPKASGLFSKFELGNCHEMCLSCCVEEAPQYVISLSMAEEMLEEMGRFSKLMGKMNHLGRMMAKNASIEELENTPVRIDATSQRMIAALEAKKATLADAPPKEKAMGETKRILNLFQQLGEEDEKEMKEMMGDFLKQLEKDTSHSNKKENGEAAVPTEEKAIEKDTSESLLSAQQIFDKAMTWIRKEKPKRCPKCQKYPVKPAAIFDDYELGKCHDLCFMCGMDKLPLEIKKIKIADAMIAEMQGISDVLDELILMQPLIDAGEMEKARQVNIKETPVEAKSPEQFLARKVIEVIGARKQFLEGIGENAELIEMADSFIRNFRK